MFLSISKSHQPPPKLLKSQIDEPNDTLIPKDKKIGKYLIQIIKK